MSLGLLSHLHSLQPSGGGEPCKGNFQSSLFQPCANTLSSTSILSICISSLTGSAAPLCPFID